MDIRQVQLDRRNPHGRDGVTQGDARMSIGSGVEADDVEGALGFLDLSDQFPFDVRLEEGDFDPELGRTLAKFGFDLFQSDAPVDARLAFAEEVQIRAVEEQDFHAGQI